VKPVEFCVPATKQNVQPPPTANDLFGQPLRQDYICYAAKCEKPAAAPATQILADQFGVRQASKFTATKVCVPATKFPVLCGAVGRRTCGGACPTGQQCVANAATGCGCQPTQCGGAPDKSGMCGGTCPNDQVCRLTTTTAGRVGCACQQLPPPPCGKNPLTGSCGGDCTDPTLKCLPDDASGDCGCRTAPDQFCGPAVGAACGGSCPNPDDKCTSSTADPNKPCICEPGPCHQDPLTGACTGTCDPAGPGGTCHLNVDNQCTCGPPPCGLDATTGQCGGSCSGGDLCAPNAANQCSCISPCRLDNQAVCGGACPPGELCQQQGPDCTCTQPAPCNFGAEVAGFCSGACPPGKSCHTKQVNKSTLACLCLDE
jgi:hypothetical protein